MAESLSYREALTAALDWQIESGADVALEAEPQNRLFVPRELPQPPRSAREPIPLQEPEKPAGDFGALGTAEAARAAKQLAASCNSLQALRQAIAGFDGVALKFTATNMVFADGNPETARIMLVGEGPGEEEDARGLPFVGPAGRFLNRMLEAAGISREKDAYITNVVNWRPPGNRQPTHSEMLICRPFLLRHIELARPKLLVFLGNTAVKALLDTSRGITKIRGEWNSFRTSPEAEPIPALLTYHPSYLLRTPIHRREAWRDFLALKERARELGL
jgi:DNA polymerase